MYKQAPIRGLSIGILFLRRWLMMIGKPVGRIL